MTIPTVNGGAGIRSRNSGNDFMRTILILLLAVLLPFMASARLVEQIYDTNSQLVVDAHVVGLISSPTGGVSAASVSNIVLNMANSLGVSNSAYSSNFVGRVITNQFNQGIDITNPASQTFTRQSTNGNFEVGGALITTNGPFGVTTTLGWDSQGGTTLVLTCTNGALQGALIDFVAMTELLPRPLDPIQTFSNALVIQRIGLDPYFMSFDPGGPGIGTMMLGDSHLASQNIEFWGGTNIDFCSSQYGLFNNNLDLRIDINNATMYDGNMVQLIDFFNHNFYSSDATIFYTGDATHLFRGNGASITNINGGTFTGPVLNTTNGTVRIGTTVGNHLVNITSASNDVVAINSSGTDSASMLHIRNLTVQGPFFSFESAPQNWGWGLSSLGNFVLRNSPTNTDPVNGTTRFSIDTNGITHADGSGITNTIIFDTPFPSATNKLTLNNGRWLLQSATPGSLTNIIVAAPYTWATLVVSNSSATTNTFLISAAARYFGLVSTNLIQVYPGKMAYISIDAMANVWTNICTVTQQ